MFKKFLFKKIELWVLLILFMAGVAFTLFLGWNVWQVAFNPYKNSFVTRRITQLVETANTLVLLVKEPSKATAIIGKDTSREDMACKEQRFGTGAGFTYSYEHGTRPDAGYLLLSRYDGDAGQSVIELVDLNAQKSLHRWKPNAAKIIEKLPKLADIGYITLNDHPNRMRYFHPFLEPDGSLWFHNGTPLIHIDSDGKYLENIPGIFHHTIEKHPLGYLCAPGNRDMVTRKNVSENYLQNTVECVNTANGERTLSIDIYDIFENNGMSHHWQSRYGYQDDPFHTNDVQPVYEDGPYWQTGDLFISVRDLNLVFLYRPETNKILWKKTGPWQGQHDIDILDNHRIAIFDNNRKIFRFGKAVAGHNNIYVFDFKDNRLKTPYTDALKHNNVRTVSEGLFTIRNNKNLFVEETNHGRIMELDSHGNIIWQFINRAQDGRPYITNWSCIFDNNEFEPLGTFLSSNSIHNR